MEFLWTTEKSDWEKSKMPPSPGLEPEVSHTHLTDVTFANADCLTGTERVHTYADRILLMWPRPSFFIMTDNNPSSNQTVGY